MSRILVILCLPLLCSGLRLPAAAEDPAEAAKAESTRVEVQRLVEQLDSRSFEVRRRAAAQIEKLLGRPELESILAAEFSRALLRPETSFEVRWRLERWSAGLPDVPLRPPKEITSRQIDRLVEQLSDDSYAVRLGATQRLQWLLSQEEHLGKVKKELQAWLSKPLEAEAAQRLKKLLELAQPAMVAEYWYRRQHLSEQHLLVGVPSMAEGAQRPSHFDRIDEKTAHCVSGNTLSPGEYPVGVAFPHPTTEGAFFRLVNLPTPRRRLAYARYAKKDDSVRLAALSRQTLDRLLARKTALSEPELVMLCALDPREVSRFAGEYLLAVEDEPLPATGRPRTAGRPSRHAMLCAQLALEGTRLAVPGLLKAIEEHRFLPPTNVSRYRLHWLAALSIAVRDPWPGVDDWLAAQVGQTEMLIHPHPAAAEVGATAAGVLLRRHGQVPSQFELKPVGDPLLGQYRIDGYRFAREDARKTVLRWWRQDQAAP